MHPFRPVDLATFSSYFPAFSALALVDTEPNEHAVEVLKGYLNLQMVARRLLEDLRLSPDVIAHHSGIRPFITVSINELVSAGRHRDQLRRFCSERNIGVIRYHDDVLRYRISQFGKHCHLAAAARWGCPAPHVLLADVKIAELMAEKLFLEYCLGGVGQGEDLFFWESRVDRRAHIVVVNKGLVLPYSERLLNNMENDIFKIYKRRCLWGGFQVKGWSPSHGKRKWKFDRPKSPSNRYDTSHCYTLEELIDGFLYEASRRSNSPRRFSVGYALYAE